MTTEEKSHQGLFLFRVYFRLLNGANAQEKGASMAKIRYKYDEVFDSNKEAMSVAQYFHDVLRGNPDYIDTRILLNVEDCRVLLVEFEDSKTHLNVVQENDMPILELFISA